MQLKGEYIFILGLMRFDNTIESTNYTIARHLAQHNQVFYIDNPYTYKDCITLNRTNAFKRRKAHFSGSSPGIIDTDIPGLKVIITPPVASINWLPEGKVYRTMLRRNEYVICKRIEQVIKNLGIRDFIFINSFNFYYPDIGNMLPAKLSIYHCVDPLVHTYELKHGSISERQVVTESDLVICTSKQLTHQWEKLNTSTYLVPNAADVAHAGKALGTSLKIHPSLADIPSPVIGYFGAIERRIDYDLLRSVASQNAGKSFVLAGPVSGEFLPDWLSEVPNIYLTGAVPYDELPQVLKGFQVAIIPFRKDAVSAAIFPLKLFEYLGAGLPVVATDFNPDLRDYTHDTVAYCGSVSDFSSAINTALLTDSKMLKAARLSVAAANTWGHRADEFARLIICHLQQQEGCNVLKTVHYDDK